MKLNSIPEAIEDIRRGKMVIVVDDRDRENEGDLVMAASKVTPAAINFTARWGRGLICLPLKGERPDRLGVRGMVRLPALARFAAKFRLKLVSVEDLIRHRRQSEKLVRRELVTPLPTRYGNFQLHVYRSDVDAKEHLALVKGDVRGAGRVLVRV